MLQRRKRMLVICHDAGASEVISAFIRGHPDAYSYKIFVGGPAVSIFKNKGIKVASLPIGDKNWVDSVLIKGDFDAVLTGTSLGLRMEKDIRRKAKKRGIHTIVYLEHWTSYRERFGYPRKGWTAALPDEFWVGDEYGLRLAKELFPNIKVRLEPNLYFEEIKKDYQTYIGVHAVSSPGDALLFLSEPIRLGNKVLNTRVAFDEYRVLKFLLQTLLDIHFQDTLIIRFHPREKTDKYDTLLAEFEKQLDIQKSLNRSIYEDCALSSVVIGIQSMALVVALLCGKKVVSFLPDPSSVSPFVPYKEIQVIHDTATLRSVLTQQHRLHTLCA